MKIYSFFTSLDVSPVDSDVGISIWTGLFVPEPERMPCV